MNKTRQRLVNLYNELGIKTDSGISRAELEAYLTAIILVRDYIDECFGRIFIPFAANQDLQEYKDLIGDYVVFDGRKPYEIIGYRLKNQWGSFKLDEFQDVMEAVSANLVYAVTPNKIYFFNLDVDDLRKFGDFIKGYVPAGFKIIASPDNSDFNSWDRFVKSWYEFEALELPFNVLDSLGVD